MASRTSAPALFESITLIASDLEAATRFYRQTLGLQLTGNDGKRRETTARRH